MLLLAWTTTPWTLPSNLALAVHPEFEYIKIKDELTGNVYVLMEKRLEILYKDPKKAKFQILERFTGKDMEGWEYVPIFNYFTEQFKGRGYKVLCDTYVTDDSGTGIVHNSPGFGEDDQRVCLANGVCSADGFIPCPVDEKGCFTDEVPDFAGQYVKVRFVHTSYRILYEILLTPIISTGSRQEYSKALEAREAFDCSITNDA